MRFRFSVKFLIVSSVVVILAVIGGLFAISAAGLVTHEQHEGYFGPAISSDKNQIWFFQRNSSGWAIGPGWEHFTPPARVYMQSDRLSLCYLDRASGKFETVLSWNSTPLQGRFLRNYRGRVLNILGTRIRIHADGKIEYAARLSIPTVPRSETWSVSGRWPTSAPLPAWKKQGTNLSGLSEPVVAGDLEVISLPGKENFPAGIVLLNHRDRTLSIPVRNQVYKELYPNGPDSETLFTSSRKKEIDRRDGMRRTHRELVERFQEKGMREGDALLAAGKEMARLGWWPTPKQIVATRIDSFPDGVTIFTIDPMEITVGLFPDLEKAMANPGKPTEQSGRYTRHRDYRTSERLNEFLMSDPERFGIRIDDTDYLVEIIPAKPPWR
ncbi:MAG: hypothetical protein C0616_13765 [Desulfuromonas sp.]|nr:MAG: hypothetical protein C0616_13765 [Desulfuromonas sp.]